MIYGQDTTLTSEYSFFHSCIYINCLAWHLINGQTGNNDKKCDRLDMLVEWMLRTSYRHLVWTIYVIMLVQNVYAKSQKKNLKLGLMVCTDVSLAQNGEFIVLTTLTENHRAKFNVVPLTF